MPNNIGMPLYMALKIWMVVTQVHKLAVAGLVVAQCSGHCTHG